ncbi:MAG: hypothetical protein ACU0CO_15780 [Shimia sp.]
METLTRLAWIALAAVHLPPAAVLAAPGLARRLYGVDPDGAVGVLIAHRGALFLALALLSLWAAFDPALRRAAGLALGLSILGFLTLYLRAGAPTGALRTIALADAAALVPLTWVGWRAWAGPT